MPIFKNNGDLYNTAVTIKRMPKDVAVTRGNDTFYFRYYRQMNNKYVRMRWYHALGESVFIRCQIEENAEGYIYGNTSGANIYVYKSGSTHQIQWRNGTTPLLSIDCDDKRHDIGFVGVIPDLSSFAGRKMYPFCDGVTYDTIEITTTVSPYYARVGGVIDGTTNSACIHSSGSWAIRIYEVYAYSFMFDDQKALYTYDMYPATDNVSDTDGRMVDIRDSQENGITVNGSAAGGTPTSSTENFPQEGYGVQLHDIKFITNSGYDNIVPILTEDNGLDEDAGWTTQGTGRGEAEPPCTLTNGSDVRSFAFGLSGIARPAGWTIANAGSLGLLKIGRKPKWSIWNDIIDFGFFYDDNHEMAFDATINTVAAGTSGAVGTYCPRKSIGFCLEKFDGYDTTSSQDDQSVTKFHPPYMRFSDNNLTIHNHNGAFVRCLAEDLMGGNVGANYKEPNETAAYVQDNQAVFNFNKFIGGSISYRLGNLAPWNRTEAQMDDMGWKPIGVNVTLSITQNTQTRWVELANKHIVGYPYLTKDADYATVKKPFREDGFNDEGFAVGSSQWTLFDVLKELGDEADMWADMNLVVNDASGQAVDVSCKNLVCSQKCHVTRLDEPYIDNLNVPSSEYTNYRMLVNSTPSICLVQGGSLLYWYDYGGYTDRRNARVLTRFDSDNETQVYLPFIGCTISDGKVTALDTTGTNYMALVECYYVQHNEVTDEDEYMYKCCVKSSINKTTLQQNYPSCHTQWMGDQNAYRYPFGLHQGGKLQWGTIQGNQSQIYDYADTAGTHVDNTDLFAKARFIAFTGADFDFATPAIPQNATIVTNIYNVTTAPAFFIFKGVTTPRVITLWYPSCHEIATAAPAGSGDSARYYEFSQPCYRFNGDGSTSIEFYYISFVKNGNNFVRTAPAVSDINNGGKLYIYKSTNLSTPVMIKNLADVVRNGNTPVLFSCDIIGLDGARDNAAYKLQMNLSAGLASGEVYYMQITN